MSRKKTSIQQTELYASERLVTLWLDSYDDVFSDFDPRPFSKRNVSDDFVYELKKVSRESISAIKELRLLLPDKNRSAEYETVIIERLKEHFNKNLFYTKQQLSAEIKKGSLFTAIGAITMLGAGYVSFLGAESFSTHILRVLLEPASWFLMWTGLDMLVNSTLKQKTELVFYKKLQHTTVVFSSI